MAQSETRRTFLKIVSTVAAGAAAGVGKTIGQKRQNPNILWLSTEDIGPQHGCYGDRVAVTPTIDRLASKGTRYANAFTCAGVCAPSRYTIITGRYQTGDGTMHMRSGIQDRQGQWHRDIKLPKGVRFFPEYLREAGYFCTNSFKEDCQVPTLESVWDQSGPTAHWRNRTDKSQPFFHVVNFLTTHESQVQKITPEDERKPFSSNRRGFAEQMKAHDFPVFNHAQLPDERRVDPDRVPLPPYYPDTPLVRRAIAQNYDNISAMDMQCEAVLNQLEQDGLAEETIVMYWSDHGGPLARGKRWLYDSGLHVPLIVRIPNAYRTSDQCKPGTVDHQMISLMDLGPTLLNLAGLAIPENIQGRAFLGGGLTSERKYIHAARDRMDERMDTVRAVRDNRYKYIRNFIPHRPAYSFLDYAERGAIQQEIRRVETEGGLPNAMIRLMQPKAAEELYDLAVDPYELSNLATQPAHQEVLESMRAENREWMMRTGDLGLMPETDMIAECASDGDASRILAGDAGKDRLSRIIAAAEAVGKGDRKAILGALNAEDYVQRYWGCVGLGLLPRKSDHLQLMTRLNDNSFSVRIAAAQALLNLGDLNASLPTLRQGLDHADHWIRLMAVTVFDEQPKLSNGLIKALRPLREDDSKYVARVVNRTLNRIEGTAVSVR
jgi:uncharacterized sulfatase